MLQIWIKKVLLYLRAIFFADNSASSASPAVKDNNEIQDVSTEAFQGYGLDSLDSDLLAYAEQPKGIPVVTKTKLIERYSDEIGNLKTIIGISEAHFDEFVLPVLENFILFADLLPASEFKHHATAGGLIEHAFQCAKLAAQKSHLAEYPAFEKLRSDVQRSKRQWRVGTVLAAFLHDSGKVVSDMIVHNGLDANDKGYSYWDIEKYPTLNDWARDKSIESYYIKWRKNRHQLHILQNGPCLRELVTRDTWAWIKDCPDGQSIFNTMLSAVAGSDVEHPLARILIQSDIESVRHDMLNQRRHITKEFTRVKISEVIVSILKHLIVKEELEVNRKGSRVWFIDEKLYLSWESLVPIIIDELEAAEYKTSTVPDVIGELMIEEGVCQAYSENQIYEYIAPEILGKNSNPILLKSLRVTDPSKLIVDLKKLYPIKQHESYIKEQDAKKAEEEKALKLQNQKEKTAETSNETLVRIMPFLSKKETKSDVPKNKKTDHVFSGLASFIIDKFDCEVRDGVVYIKSETLKEEDNEMILVGWLGLSLDEFFLKVKTVDDVVITGQVG